MPARNQPWVRDIVNRKTHILWHQTSRQCALSILETGYIHGAYLGRKSGEAFPHFIYEGWPTGQNWLPYGDEITLIFQSSLPARYKGEGELIPEKGYLEVYSSCLSPERPWQCSIHPDSEPLKFIGCKHWRPNTSWHDWFPIGRSLDKKLNDETLRAAREKRKISGAFWV